MNIYDKFYRAYRIYNERLFGNGLGDIIITFVRKPLVKGYYSFSRFQYLDDSGKTVSEISINPEYFAKASDKMVLSTLVHEMCHMYHDTVRNNCVRGYHDKAWAEIMEGIGLIPSSTGQPGGKKTGFLMSHYIQSGGRFDVVTEEVLKDGFSRGFIEVCVDEKRLSEKDVDAAKGGYGQGRRFKYSCGCSNVWGKKNLNLKCNICGNDFKEISK